ncbi:MAG: hydrogenase subunit [Candidatus Bathyarchaeota archaeon]|nr:hydrogenase subunit [Candidatus Bathyarchaeota archaeon]
MIIAPAEDITQILIVLVLATAAIILVKRNLRSLIQTYAFQSALLAVMALLFFVETGIWTLLGLAILIIVSKVVVIPYFMGQIQRRLHIKRDVQFHFLSPITSLFVSIFIVLFVYLSFSTLIAPLNIFDGSLFFLGAATGMSLMFMGMMVIFTRKQTITNIVGYLTMENGVVLFSLFLTELPLLIEVLIVVDLIMLTLLATILAFGIDSTIEEFHSRLNIFQETTKKLQQPRDGRLEDIEATPKQPKEAKE